MTAHTMPADCWFERTSEIGYRANNRRLGLRNNSHKFTQVRPNAAEDEFPLDWNIGPDGGLTHAAHLGDGLNEFVVSTIWAGKHMSYEGFRYHVADHRLKNTVRSFLADETGATGIEYCLIATGIALGILVSVAGIEASINANFAAINSSLK